MKKTTLVGASVDFKKISTTYFAIFTVEKKEKRFSLCRLRKFFLGLFISIFSCSLFCLEAGDWITRIRGLYILPSDNSGPLSTIPGSGVKDQPAWTAEFDVAYMFTRYIGAELILSTAYSKLVGTKSIEGLDVGSTWVLPPTLTMQGYFFPDSCVHPYLGAGLNFTAFYAKDCHLPNTTLHISPSWGPALQGGLDFYFASDYLLNMDVKYIWIWPEARLSGATTGIVKMDINPWLFGLGLGKKW